jgi:PelA/Pel-15E family pectate lyase
MTLLRTWLLTLASLSALGYLSSLRAGGAADPLPVSEGKKSPEFRDPAWQRWHPAPPPFDPARLPARPELPTQPIELRTPAGPRSAAEIALRKGLDFYYQIATKADYPDYGKCAGWCGSYSADLKFRSGEDAQQIPADAVKMQAVGTPQVTEAYLSAALALGDPALLDIARAGGNLMLAGQSPYGGWFFEMWIGPQRARGSHVWPGKATWPDPGPEHGTDSATFDDGNTFGPAETLYKLWWVTKDQRYYEAWHRAMDFILLAQQAYGGSFPQAFPSDGYHRYATFNDGVTENCVEALLIAYQRTGDKRYFNGFVTCADWILRVQRPGQGWGAQHDENGAIASARRFEPAGLEPPGTSAAMAVLTRAYEWTGDPKYLVPLSVAAVWLEKVQVKPGVWARYYHPDTNEPWYRTVDGQDCDFAHAKGGYTWQGGWGKRGLELAAQYKSAARKAPRPAIPVPGDPSFEAAIVRHARPDTASVDAILASQSSNGCWPGGGRSGRQKNDPKTADGVGYFGSFVFVNNVHRLAEAVRVQP